MLGHVRACCLVSLKEDTEETRDLCVTLDLDIVAEIFQRRHSPDPNTFVGSGKLEDLKKVSSEVDLFVFDGTLKPAQHFRLETTLKRPCIDRIGLVLETFDRHAGSSEAKAQTALARIRYELPFLKEWISKSKSDDRPGFLAGGEYAIDVYYENARRRAKRLESSLRRLAKERAARRGRRRDLGFYLVSICGYTNSGKTSLLNALSGSSAQVDNRLFSTLSIMTRQLRTGKKILLTDTVGFMRSLPPDLLDAFNATMEEIYASDCVILMMDFSDSIDEITEKTETALELLNPHIDKERIIIAFNKIDMLSEEKLEEKLKFVKKHYSGYIYYLISIQKKIEIENLIIEIFSKIGITKTQRILLRNDTEGKKDYKWIIDRFLIIDAKWRTRRIELVLQLTPDELEILRKRAKENDRMRICPSS